MEWRAGRSIYFYGMYYSFIRPALLAAFIFISFLALAQSDVRITVTGTNKESIAGASLVLRQENDSALVFRAITDSSGTGRFSGIQEGIYRLEITSVGYEPAERGITVIGSGTFSITLQPLSRQLEQITVTASRPMIRQEDDKTIVDPENLAASSTNSFEILEKTPGLFVDQDGNIYLNSTTPATVYINGREQRMSAADIATILKNLPPNAIASIEILRTPSARYDASGSGGIVNVVLKKGVRIGLTGSVTVGGNQGDYGNRFAGASINNNNGKLSTYLNLQYGGRNSFDRIVSERKFVADTMLSQNAFTRYSTGNGYIGYGISFPFGSNWDFSYDGRFSFSNSENRSRNQSIISSISTQEVSRDNIAEVRNEPFQYNLNQGLHLKLKTDSAGSEWVTDLSFSYTPSGNDQLYFTYFNHPVAPELSGQGDIVNRLFFFSAQTNFLKKLKGDLTIESGLKTTHVDFSNTTDYRITWNGFTAVDDLRSGSYEYRENINAAFVQGSRRFGKFILKMGIRGENTNMRGHQIIPRDTSFTLHRTDLFPYIYLSRYLMSIARYELRTYLVYRRTISRPAYEYLNPSLRFVDPYLVETGNPSLRPQFTQNYEANISVDERPLFAIGINDTRDIFTQVVYQADSSREQAFRTYDNLGSNREMYFRALGAIPPGGKYFFVAGGQYNHNFYQGHYEDRPLEFRRGTWTVFTYHQFRFNPLTLLSMHGFARFRGQLQFYELSSFGSLNMSLTRQFMNRKLAVTLSMSDIFYTNRNEFTLLQGTVDASGLREADTRRIGLNIRYNFGIRKKEENGNIFNIDPERPAQ